MSNHIVRFLSSRTRTFGTLGLVACLAASTQLLALRQSNASGEPRDVDQAALGLDLAALFRASRAVIADQQTLINDASKGDKGLSPDVVVAKAKENYRRAMGRDFSMGERGTPEAEAKEGLVAAIADIMNQAQPLINEPGVGFKGFLPAVFARMVANQFSKTSNGKFSLKLTAPKSYVRNRANRPDPWEQNVIESKFKSAAWQKGQHFAEATSDGGRAAYRVIIPEYYNESCLACHGSPKGERDITGGKKEGGTLGELGGAISVALYE